jgi:hypothetical protein
VVEQAGGSIAFRFHARDAHLVLSPGTQEPIPFERTVEVTLLEPGAQAYAFTFG